MATILQNAGTHKILTSNPTLFDTMKLIEQAGRTCYQSEKDIINRRSAGKFIKMLMKRGHYSVLEHGSITVQFSNVSRGFTHELVRHHLCAFSQESTRYVDESDLRFVLPPDKAVATSVPTDHGNFSLNGWISTIEQIYAGLLKQDWKPKDARQFLPIGTVSQIVVSTNFREWRHIFIMRTSKHAHWEIRRVMGNLLEELIDTMPEVFGDFRRAGVGSKDIPYYKSKYGA